MPEAAAASLKLFRKIEENAFLLHKASALRNIQKYENRLSTIVEMLGRVTHRGKLASEIHEELKRILISVTTLRRSLKEPFHLFVVGLTKAGKSSLVNALLGQEVAKVDFLPATWRIDVFKHSPNEPWAELHWEDGTIERLTVEEAQNKCKEEEKRRSTSEDQAEDLLNEKAASLTADQLVEYQRYLWKEVVYHSPLVEAHWPYSGRSSISDFLVVDTPGLLQQLAKSVEIGVQNYLHKADGIVWVLSAKRIVDAGNKDLLEEIEASLRKLGARPRDMIAVLNKFDEVTKYAPGSEERIVLEAQRLFSEYFEHILPLCAKNGMRGAIEKDDALIRESNLPGLLDLILTTYRQKAARIQAENKTVGLQSCLRHVVDLLDGFWEKASAAVAEYEDYKNGFSLDIEHVNGDFEEQLDEILQKHKINWYGNIENRAKALMKDISGIDQKLGEIQKSELIRSKVESTVIHTGELKHDAEESANLYEQSINSIVTRYLNRIRFDEYSGIDALIQRERVLTKFCDSRGFQIACVDYNDADSSGSVLGGGAIGIGAAFFLAPLIGPFALLVPFVGGWLGWLFKGEEFKGKLKQAADAAIDQAKKDIQEHAHKISISAHRRLMDHLDREFTNLYFDHSKAENLRSEVESGIRGLRFEPENGRVADLLLRSSELR